MESKLYNRTLEPYMVVEDSVFQKKEEQKSELEKFNQENKQVYEDFIKFCNENPNKRKYAESQYEIEFPNNKYSINFVEKNGKISCLSINFTENDFYDWGLNGLDERNLDGYTFTDESGLIESKFLKELSSKKQLEVAKEYTETLKEIMRKEKYKKY